MRSKMVEATNIGGGGCNWGKFLVSSFEIEEFRYRSEIDGLGLLQSRGWQPDNVHVLDLQTGEGAIFRPGGSVEADLRKHKIWVCPLFEPFLEWLYKQDLSDVTSLPALVNLDEVEGALWGYRRPGPQESHDGT